MIHSMIVIPIKTKTVFSWKRLHFFFFMQLKYKICKTKYQTYIFFYLFKSPTFIRSVSIFTKLAIHNYKIVRKTLQVVARGPRKEILLRQVSVCAGITAWCSFQPHRDIFPHSDWILVFCSYQYFQIEIYSIFNFRN